MANRLADEVAKEAAHLAKLPEWIRKEIDDKDLMVTEIQKRLAPHTSIGRGRFGSSRHQAEEHQRLQTHIHGVGEVLQRPPGPGGQWRTSVYFVQRVSAIWYGLSHLARHAAPWAAGKLRRQKTSCEVGKELGSQRAA